jgi:hypothetical protein
MAETSTLKRDFEQEIKFRSQQSEKRDRLLAALADYIHKNDGWVISAPNSAGYIRFECRELAALPIRLAELGHRLRYCGSGERNIAERSVVTDIFETKLLSGR